MQFEALIQIDLLRDDLALVSDIVELDLESLVLVFNDEDGLLYGLHLQSHLLALHLDILQLLLVQQRLLLGCTLVRELEFVLK